MNLEFFIAKRLAFGDRRSNGKKRLSQLMTRISIVSIALSLAVMIISVAVVTEFKAQIYNKLTAFNSHIQLTNYDSNTSYETTPIEVDQELIDNINRTKGVTHVRRFITKGAIIKAGDENQGVVLKGVSSDFNWGFFQDNLLEGEVLTIQDTVTSYSVMISKSLSQKLNLKTGDILDAYFVQEPVKVRRLTVSGIYATYVAEMDNLYLFCDLKLLQRVDGWSANKVSGLEIAINDIDRIDNIANSIEETIAYKLDEDGNRLKVSTIAELFPELIGWLQMLNMNVVIILVLMLIVAGFNMISGLLIMLLEKVSMIGVLKSLGMSNNSLQRMFLYRSSYVILTGLFWGNIIGITCCLIQQYFGVIKLDPVSYYFLEAPVRLNVIHLLLLNVGSFVVILAAQLIPSLFILKVSPDKTIRFD